MDTQHFKVSSHDQGMTNHHNFKCLKPVKQLVKKTSRSTGTFFAKNKHEKDSYLSLNMKILQ